MKFINTFYGVFEKKNLLIFLLVFVGVATRIITHTSNYVYWTLYGSESDLYITAIKENFLEYIFFYHIKPPINLFVDKFFLLFSNNLSLERLIFISFLDVVASVMIFSILREKINKYSALLFSIIFSVSIVTYEIWRLSANHDHIKLFIVVFYLFALIRIQKLESRVNVDLFIFSTFLISISFSSAFLFFLIVSFVSYFTKNRKNTRIKYAYFFGLFITILISFKNYYNTSNFTQSTSLGQNMIQLVWAGSNKYASCIEFQKLVNRNANYFPDWWITSFNIAIREDIENKNGFPFNAIYGIANRDSLIQNIKDPNVLALLKRDSILLKQKPWLYISEIPESSSLFSAKYGKASTGAFKIAIREFPDEFLYQLWTSQKLFFKGPLFFINDQIYEPTHITINRFFYISGFLFLIVLISGIVRFVFNIICVECIKKNFDLILFVILNGVFLNIFTCCENIRMFVPFTPIFFVWGVYFLNSVSTSFREKIKTFRLNI